jgi:hypothetical protein
LKKLGVSMEYGSEQRGVNPLLYVAALHGNAAYGKQLLDLGADVNARGYPNATPLMLAAGDGNGDFVNLLLSAGADPTLKDNAKLTAADYARRRNHPVLATSLEAAAKSFASSPAAQFKRDPKMPFRIDYVYRVKQLWKGGGAYGDYFHPNQEFVYNRAIERDGVPLLGFVFLERDAPRQHEWAVLPEQVALWDQYFEELGPAKP